MDAQIILYILTAACLTGLLFAPLRVAVVCLLVSSHLNLTSLDAGGAAVGLLNSLRILAFPIILYGRLLFKSHSRVKTKNLGFWIWLVFFLYAAASLLWLKVDNLVPYLKQLGYLYTYLITYIVLCKAFHTNFLREREIIYFFVIATFIAVLQTYWSGNMFGSTLNWSRFVSFTAKQQFAEYLLSVFVIFSSSRSISLPLKLILGLAVLIEMYLNGSRTGLIAVVSAMGIFALAAMSIKNPERFLRIAGMLALVSVVCFTLGVVYKDKLIEQVSQSRVSELFDFASTSKLDDVGSMSDRLDLWEQVSNKVDKFDMFDHLFGRGLTSGVEVVSGLGIHDASVSANRIFHNEYLRVYYELGIVGLLIFLSFIIVIILFSWRVKRRTNDVALLSFLPGFFAFLSVENILSASGNAGGVGILLVFSYATYLYEQAKRNRGKNLVGKKSYSIESPYKAA